MLLKSTLLCVLFLFVWANATSVSFGGFEPFPDQDTYNKTCPYELLTCSSGGDFRGNCTEWQQHCANDILEEQRIHPACTCPDTYTGADCQILVNPKISKPNVSHCGKNEPFDGTIVNLNQEKKHLECYFTYKDAKDLSIRSHRVVVDVDRPDFEHSRKANVKFTIMSRHRNGSIPVGAPHHHWCGPMLRDLDCHMEDCTTKTIGDKSYYECPRGNCTSCYKQYPKICSPLLTEKDLTWPFKFSFSNMDYYNGTSDLLLKLKIAILHLECKTGSCSKYTINTNYSPATSALWKTLLLGGIGGAFLLSIFLAALWARRTGQLADKGHDHDHQIEQMKTLALKDLPLFGLVFRDITYQVDIPTADGPVQKNILNGISGYIRPKELVAFMGSSGAGKSSLMDILAGRDKTGRVDGHVSLICTSHGCRKRDKVVSYIPQDDHILHTQTVREALTFSARMRLPPSYTDQMIYAKVTQVMMDLKLSHIADSRIGHADAGGGISGGERKRVAIGIELVADPRLLLLDEPTSGLDSYSAQIVMDVLKETTRKGCACVLTIHQPPSKIYKMFDNVLLLTRVGYQAYYGDPMQAIEHFSADGMEIDKWTNPAEYVLDIVSDHDHPERLQRLPGYFFASQIFQKLQHEMSHALTHGAIELPMGDVDKEQEYFINEDADIESSDDEMYVGSPGAEGYMEGQVGRVRHRSSADKYEPPLMTSQSAQAKGGKDGYMTVFGGDIVPKRDDSEDHMTWLPVYKRERRSMCSRIGFLLVRSLQHLAREPSLLAAQWALTILLAGFIGGIFWDLDLKKSGIQNRLGFFFFSIMYFSLISTTALNGFVSEMRLFLRERASRFYTTFPYFVSKIICDMIPLRVIPPMMYGGIVYWMMGLDNTPEKFSRFIVVLVLVNVVAASACFFFSAVVKDVGTATLMASLFFIFCTLFGGLFLANDPDSDSPLVHLTYTSYFYYGFEALNVNEFQNLQVWFNPTEQINQPIPGEAVLNFFHLRKDWLYKDMLVLGSFAVFFIVSAFVALFFRKYKK